jgi:hypothetical protein
MAPDIDDLATLYQRQTRRLMDGELHTATQKRRYTRTFLSKSRVEDSLVT